MKGSVFQRRVQRQNTYLLLWMNVSCFWAWCGTNYRETGFYRIIHPFLTFERWFWHRIPVKQDPARVLQIWLGGDECVGGDREMLKDVWHCANSGRTLSYEPSVWYVQVRAVLNNVTQWPWPQTKLFFFFFFPLSAIFLTLNWFIWAKWCVIVLIITILTAVNSTFQRWVMFYSYLNPLTESDLFGWLKTGKCPSIL